MPCSARPCWRLGQFVQPVPRCFAGTCFGALAILGPSAADYLRSLGFKSAARCRRLCLGACFRAEGPCRTHLNDTFGIFYVSSRRRGAGGYGHGVFAGGALDPFGDRGGGLQIRRCGHHDWRGSDLGFSDHHGALDGGKLGGGMVLAFAKAKGEIEATITFVANISGQAQTLPLMIYTFLQVQRGMLPRFGLLVPSVFISVFAPAPSEVQAYDAFLALNHSAGDVKLALAARFFR